VAKKLYVGNLPYSYNDSSLHQLFSEVGTVDSARVIMDRDTGRSKGFGFVEMANDDDADRARMELNGKDVGGRRLVVNEARPQERRNSSFDGPPRRGSRKFGA